MIDDWLNSYTKLDSGHMIAKVTRGDSKNLHAEYSSGSAAELEFAWNLIRRTKKTEQCGLIAGRGSIGTYRDQILQWNSY